MWASTPTSIIRIRIGASVFVGAYRRADRVVRPYGCVRVRIGTSKFAVLYCAGGVEPRSYANVEDAIHTIYIPQKCVKTMYPYTGAAR